MGNLRSGDAERSVPSFVMQESEDHDRFEEADLEQLARQWLRDICQNLDSPSDSGGAVVSMNFSASPEIQWRFILIAVVLADTDLQLGHIAAGPIEHLLGWYGESYIVFVENEAQSNPKFARALTGVWQYMMTDEVWARVQRLQENVSQPLEQ